MASQELRNDTAGVRRRVQAGEKVMVAVNGKPVTQLVALQQTRRRWLPRQNWPAGFGWRRPIPTVCGVSWRLMHPTAGRASGTRDHVRCRTL